MGNLDSNNLVKYAKEGIVAKNLFYRINHNYVPPLITCNITEG